MAIEVLPARLEADRRRIRSLRRLAEVERSHGRLREAERLLCSALALAERALGASSLEVAELADDLAETCRQAALAEAERLQRQALAIHEAVLGAEHSGLAPILNNLACVLASRGALAEAEDVFERALTLLEYAVESDDPTLVAIRENYAAVADAAQLDRS